MMALRNAVSQTGRLVARAVTPVTGAGSSCRTMASITEAADMYYRQIDQSFYNYPLDRIRIEVGTHYVRNEPHPMLFFGDDEDARSGIMHTTPFAPAAFPFFGPQGNLGKKMNFGPGVVSEPENAEQEIGISSASLDGEGQSKVTVEYFEWLSGIQDKLLDHLMENSESYPALQKKVRNLKAKNYSHDVLREMMSNDATGLIKQLKDENKSPIEGSDFIQFKQKVYFRTQDEGRLAKARIMTPTDEQMQKKGFVRRHIPLYDSEGNEVPLEEARIYRNDIISVQNNVTCNLYNIGGRVGFGLRRNIRSIVLLKRANSTSSSEGDAPQRASPFSSVNLNN